MTKKALLIGINYKGQSKPLRGCVNDAWNVANFLVNNFSYQPGNIKLLTDDPNFHGGGLPQWIPQRKENQPAETNVDDVVDDGKKDKKEKKEKKDKKDKKDKDKKGKDKKDKKDKKDNKDKKDKKDKKGKKDKKEKNRDVDYVYAADDELPPNEQQFRIKYEEATRDGGSSAGFQRGDATRASILEGCNWLIAGASAGDSLFLHYSGHGIQVTDKSGDEDDGMDEAICPVDFRTAGVIVDDDLHEIIVKNIPDGVTLTVIMDCCHSGTGLDLPFLFAAKTQELKSEKKKKKKKGKKDKKKAKDENRGGLVVMFSGCEDAQVSADVVLDGIATGAVSFSFISSLIQNNLDMTYSQLLFSIKAILLERVKNVQYPVLSTNVAEFDFSSKVTI